MISTLLMNTRTIIDLTTIPWDTPARTHPFIQHNPCLLAGNFKQEEIPAVANCWTLV
jgi:hypothetical protein